ncbi:MAG TPA: aminoglycoside 3'-phosphotransferase [Mycobacteriales bacterium]|nr:aminoglycoside 3'-phosphotransferase [Mycobacteriales bacterium]
MRIPDEVLAAADGERLELVWENGLGGRTFRLGSDRFVKWVPPGEPELDIPAEVARLRWAAQFTPVPVVVAAGETWMITTALPGETAISERWKRDPEPAVTAIGRGLRALHDALPVEECPFSWSVESRLPLAESAPQAVREFLAAPPPIDRLVVCHGDACAPNTLLDGSGRWVAHVDLGQLGVADRWADLAVATWSTEWNYGPGWEDTLLRAYGIAADPVRIAYYRKLWDPNHGC